MEIIILPCSMKIFGDKILDRIQSIVKILHLQNDCHFIL